MLVIAHRGASGYRPEHTLASYELAIAQGADVIEPDVVPTSDGHLVVRHESAITETTDVADHPELADRRTTKTIDGRQVTGWFTEDLTLAELQTLRAREPLPALRPESAAYADEAVLTLDEVLALARRSTTRDGRPVGVAPETKHPTYFRSIGLPLEEALVDALHRHGWSRRDDPVVIQSFETGNLQTLAGLTDLPLMQVCHVSGAPYDLRSTDDPRTYLDLMTPQGLAAIKEYADHVGLHKDLMIPRDADGRLLEPTQVLRDAHEAGLRVTGWTFRRENRFLPLQLRGGDDLDGVGDLAGEISTFVRAGMDDFFTDNPDVGAAVRTAMATDQRASGAVRPPFAGRSPGAATITG
ncbi:glycerophosphodiester phosphodiesterase [Microlunatus antarcticus]|uniref:glycerophosphodiester phosphodiesterase n=1 Tax=Microlunatus antarcticus TaxID=53388 RepID=A0A7W5JSV3_9ACTN|nr:glycerophosphodiester phosphodiesterase [Microlunatus antarcticus]MBB3325406.1 glycerophosphoryl diester phosphodiesterase [Microlunatus antarcticus]